MLRRSIRDAIATLINADPANIETYLRIGLALSPKGARGLSKPERTVARRKRKSRRNRRPKPPAVVKA